jgi:hypothetical protein
MKSMWVRDVDFFEKYISYVLFYFQFKMFNNLAQQKIISGLKVMFYSKINDLDRS